MAKSKNGGTRAMIRGRVGSDVYSVGKDSAGKKQQIVRSLPESVANPQTLAQMRGRMIMFTVMQAITQLRPIVDHSFDTVVGKQPNLSQFIRLNYRAIKIDVAANSAADNKFGLNAYQEKGIKRGQYQISEGEAALPAVLALAQATGITTITLSDDALTIGGLKSSLGLTSEEYFTLVGISTDSRALYARLRVNPNLADNTAINASSISNVFAIEGNVVPVIALSGNKITVTVADIAGCSAIIVSRKVNGAYIHNTAVLGDGTGFETPADLALPTYPVGTQDYLNGGDIFGASETVNGNVADDDTPSGGDDTPSGGDDGPTGGDDEPTFG